ncbi:MAG: S8 family serine peptidase, partial [Candidatus Hydrogenedentes bacterium]|nr:S8 family serine peptidase [Candidatus Hydrogenedentota bacterium]
MKVHALPSIPLLEPLEARLMLSADALTPLVATFAGTLELSEGETVALAQGPGEASQAFTDAGDYYWYYGQQIPLLRATSEIVVSIASGENGEELIQQWTQADGPLAGYEIRSPLNDNLFVLGGSASSPDAASALEAVSAGGKVAWSGPAFMYEETGSRLWATNEIIVKIRPGVDPAAFFAEFGSYRQLFMSQYVISVQGGSLGSLQTANTLANNPNVEWASPNFYQDFRSSTDDTLYSSQWHLNNTGQTGALSGADADVAEAWSTTTGSDDIVIAVLDNGVQTNHPDLNIYINPGEIAGNGIDDDQNGFIDDVNGWDFTGTGDNNPNPTTAFDNHGTAVAGVAAAHGSNELGVTVGSQHSTILPIKIATQTASSGGFVDSEILAQAVYYAGGFLPDGSGPQQWHGADIINCSWGGGTPDPTLSDAFDFVAENGRYGLGCAVFVAAGNSATGYKAYVDPEIAPGTWFFQWEYVKNNDFVTAGDDSVWLANVSLPDGTRQTFLPTSDLTGWQTGGNADWTINTDATRAYFADFVGGRQLRAGTIGNNQWTALRSPTVTVGAEGGEFTFNAWVSSQLNGDFLNVWGFDGTWHLLFQESGVPTLTTAVSYPASLNST